MGRTTRTICELELSIELHYKSAKERGSRIIPQMTPPTNSVQRYLQDSRNPCEGGTKKA